MIALLGVPWDGSSSSERGSAEAPPRIRKALRAPSSNSWNERGDDIAAEGLVDDQGDLELTDAADEVRQAIEAAVGAILERGKAPLVLGGDHSITYPILRAFRPRLGPPTVLHFDAHGDIYDSFNGDRYSHACPFARVLEEGCASRVVQVGVRTLNAHQREQVARFGVESFGADRWREALPVVASLEAPVYVSLDIDVLEPMLAPGISHPEPGGLTVREVLDVLNMLRVPVVGADVVEYNPRRDFRDLTARVAAKFVKELIGLLKRR